MIRVTVDTTTLASGFVRRGAPPGRLIAVWQQRLFTLVTAEPLIAKVVAPAVVTMLMWFCQS